MSAEISALVLIAAALHAGWNALIKISGERVAVMALVTFAGSLLSLLALPFVDSPDPASWPFLVLTILLHTGYHFFLPVAYDHGDLGQVTRSPAFPDGRETSQVFSAQSPSLFAAKNLGLAIYKNVRAQDRYPLDASNNSRSSVDHHVRRTDGSRYVPYALRLLAIYQHRLAARGSWNAGLVLGSKNRGWN